MRVKKLLESNTYLEEFDGTVFENIVDKIIVGGINQDGEINPALITIIYKTGKNDLQEWEKDFNYNSEAYEFSEVIIKQYRELYIL